MKERRGFVQKVPTGFCAGYFLKVPTTYLLGMSWVNWWALFENDQDVPAGYFTGQIGGYFPKVPTIYLLGLGWANGWVLFECAHYLPAGYELGKLFQNPQLTHNVPTGYIALHPQWDKISLSGLSLAEIVLTAVNSVPSREEQGWLGGLGVSEDMSVRYDPLLHPETLQADASISFVHVCLTGIRISHFINAHPTRRHGRS